MWPCPHPDQLISLLADEQTETQVAALSEHLQECAACRRILDQLSSNLEDQRWRKLLERGPHEFGEMRPDFVRHLRRTVRDECNVSLLTLATDPSPSFDVGLRPFPRPAGYQILEILGRGGVGVVYKARHEKLNRLVALKMLSSDGRRDDDELARFRDEAETIASLQHPNIVRIYEVGELRGLPFLALEFVDGRSLSDRIKGGPQPPRAAAELVKSLALTMQYAHDCGVVHRDLKPANILLQREGHEIRATEGQATSVDFTSSHSLFGDPKITDFGIAKRLDVTGHTETGQVLGTPSYMSPEQARGKVHEIGASSDVYALGAILYQMLTGQPPFQGVSAVDTVMRVLHEDPLPPRRLQPKVPRDLEIICIKCLEKEPGKRYLSARELAEDLDRYFDGRPIRARPLGLSGRASKWASRNPALAGLLVLLLFTTLVGVPGVTWLWLNAAESRDRAREAQSIAVQTRNASRRQSAILLLDKGLELADRREVSEALHWMVESLKTLPNENEEDRALARLVRINLASWGQQLHRPIAALDTSEIACATFSPDGNLLATGHHDGVIRLWDAETGRPRGIPMRNEYMVTEVAFSPSGRTLLAGYGRQRGTFGDASGCILWDVATGRKLGDPLMSVATQKGADGHHVAWSRDGSHFATGVGQEVRYWETKTGRPVGGPWTTRQQVAALMFSTDDRSLLVATNNIWSTPNGWRGSGEVEIWDVAAGFLAGTFIETEEAAHRNITLAPDGETIAVGSYSGSLKYQKWDPLHRRAVGAGRTIPGGLLRIASDGSAAIFWKQDGSAVPLDLASGRPSGLLIRSDSSLGSAAFNPTRETLLNGNVIWRLARNRSRPAPGPGDFVKWPVEPIPEPARAVRVVPKARLLVVSHRKNLVQSWDLARDRPAFGPMSQCGGFAAITSDGARLAAIFPGPDGSNVSARIWDTATGAPLSPPLVHSGLVGGIAFSPDDRILAVGTYDLTVHLYEGTTGQPIGKVMKQNDIAITVAFSPDSKILAVGTSDDWSKSPRTQLWDVDRCEPIGPPLPQQEGWVKQVVFRPDGNALLTVSPRSVRLWETATGRSLSPSLATASELPGTSFSPDGRWFLTGDVAGSVRLRSGLTGAPVGPPLRGPDEVTGAAFSPDSQSLAITYANGSARLWDVATFRPLGSPVAQLRKLLGVTWSPDNRSIFTTSIDGTTRHWPVPAPLDSDPDRIKANLIVLTALHMDSGQAVSPMDRDAWWESRRSWLEQEGSLDKVFGAPLDDATWHDLRSRDAEEDGNFQAARWHLDRLIVLREAESTTAGRDLWPTYARRLHINLLEGREKERDSDEKRISRLAPRQGLITWYQHHAEKCRREKNMAANSWYMKRLDELH